MKMFEHKQTHIQWCMTLLFAVVMVGCGSRDPVLGSGDFATLAPQVTSSTPPEGTTGVSTSAPGISATLNQPIAPLTGSASLTITCAAPCVNPTGTTTLDSTGTVATFTPTAGTALAASTQYTGTVTGARSVATGLQLATPYVWRFTTTSDATRPRVTATVPLTTSPGPTINFAANRAVVVSFTEPMLATSITGTSFTVTCTAPCVNPTGVVTYVPSSRSATFKPATPLALSTTYTARVTTAATDLVSNALAGNQAALPAASDYVWTFTTGAALDTTRPTVTSTSPVTTTPGPTPGVPNNSTVSAIFSEDVSPATLTGSSFTVTCAAPCVNPTGTVTYVTSSRTAVFTPSAPLTTAATYTATITTAVTDLASNALGGNQAPPPPAASNYVWTFTTVAAVPAANVSVSSTTPAPSAAGVCPSASVNATFNVPSGTRMDPSTVNAATFTVTGPGLTPVNASSVTLDVATGRIATFAPQSALVDGVNYSARITGGATGVGDLAVPANRMLSDYTWTFTAGPATGSCVLPPTLASAEPFGIFGGSAGMTNTGINTVINGDIGTIATGTSSITGFHDTAGDIYTESLANIGAVNGIIYTCTNSTTGPTSTGPNATQCAVATQARLHAEAAYNELAGKPSLPASAANLATLTITPGTYSAPGGSFLIEGGDLTLDAQGDANAVFIFQMATTLTVGGPGVAAPQSIILAGGAQAKNVFWQVGTSATINAGGGGTMVGTIIAQSGVTFSTLGNVALTTLNGRALSLGASVTMVNTVINVPSP